MSPEFKIKKQKIKGLRQLLKSHKKDKNVEMVLRLKVIVAYLTDRPISKIAGYFNVSAKTIQRWVSAYKSEGADALVVEKRAGRPPKLNKEQLQEVHDSIKDDKEMVWPARHVFELIVLMFSVFYPVKYLPELLKKIGLSFHKAIHYLVKRNEEKRATWIKEKPPEIYSEYIKNGWRIFFQDEVGFQTEGTLAYSWGPIGETIIVNNKGRHGRVNLMGVCEVGSGEFFINLRILK